MSKGIGKIEQAVLGATSLRITRAEDVFEEVRKGRGLENTNSSRVMVRRAVRSLERKKLVRVTPPKMGHVRLIQLVKPKPSSNEQFRTTMQQIIHVVSKLEVSSLVADITEELSADEINDLRLTLLSGVKTLDNARKETK